MKGQIRTVAAATPEMILPLVAISPGGCWLWTGIRDRPGYGRIWMPGTGMVLAHRVAYAALVGNPGRSFVLHKCDTPSCVNPAHLFLGTQGDNMRDKVAKGRARGNENRPTHCKRGHPFDSANTYLRADGSRKCRRCNADIESRRNAAKAARSCA